MFSSVCNVDLMKKPMNLINLNGTCKRSFVFFLPRVLLLSLTTMGNEQANDIALHQSRDQPLT